MTNYEKIHNMTVEELAQWMDKTIGYCGMCPVDKGTCDTCAVCEKAFLSFLREEAKLLKICKKLIIL